VGATQLEEIDEPLNCSSTRTPLIVAARTGLTPKRAPLPRMAMAAAARVAVALLPAPRELLPGNEESRGQRSGMTFSIRVGHIAEA
jgi:hypothetical protein